jgi:hypothetical protein
MRVHERRLAHPSLRAAWYEVWGYETPRLDASASERTPVRIVTRQATSYGGLWGPSAELSVVARGATFIAGLEPSRRRLDRVVTT